MGRTSVDLIPTFLQHTWHLVYEVAPGERMRSWYGRTCNPTITRQSDLALGGMLAVDLSRLSVIVIGSLELEGLAPAYRGNGGVNQCLEPQN